MCETGEGGDVGMNISYLVHPASQCEIYLSLVKHLYKRMAG